MNFFTWRSVPFVRFTFPLVVGIIVAVFINTELYVYLPLILFGFLGLIITLRTRDIDRRVFLERINLLFIFSLLAGLGMALVDVHTSNDEENHFSRFDKVELLRGIVKESPQQKNKSLKSILSVEKVWDGESWSKSTGDLLVYFEQAPAAVNLEIGDEISFPASYQIVDPPANPGQFNYKRFLSFRDIYNQQYIKVDDWVKVDEHWSLRRTSERWRKVLLGQIDKIGMERSEKSIASALLLGKKENLDPELIQSYASAGAMHVLAVSGLHVGIIFFILRFCFQWVDRLRKGAIIKAVILILCLWVYAFITGLSPSVVRAATMFSAVTLGTGLNRKSSIYNTVASSAFILLIINPYYIMEVGFQLSYLAVVGIIFLHPKIYALLYFPSWLADKIWQITCVSIAAQIATFPLGLLYFHQFPTYFLISNLLVIPAAFLILYVGLAYLLLSWVPVIGVWLGKLLGGLIWFLNQGVGIVEGWPHSLIKGIDIGIFLTWAIYLMVGSVLIALIYRKRLYLISGALILSLIMCWQLYELFSFKRVPHLVVYDVRGDSVINLLNESENLVYCDPSWESDLSKQQFHLRNNWNKHAAPEPLFMSSAEHSSVKWINDIMIYKDCSIALLDKKWNYSPTDKAVRVDYLIVSYHKGLSLKKVLDSLDPELIILDGTIRGKTIERMRKEAADRPIHVINEDGYFRARI